MENTPEQGLQNTEEKLASSKEKQVEKVVPQQPNHEELLKELAELRAFKTQAETKVKEDVPVRDSFLSSNEPLVSSKKKTESEKLYEEMLHNKVVYRDME